MASNGTVYVRSGRWLEHHLASILAAYPAKLRTGGQRALTAIDAALCRIADSPEHPGTADPFQWLLGRVMTFAASERPKQPRCWEAPAWFEQGHYDDPDESWQQQRGDAPGSRGGSGPTADDIAAARARIRGQS